MTPDQTKKRKVNDVLDGKLIKECFFTEKSDNTFICQCGSKVNQIIKNGYTNLRTHLDRYHINWKNEIRLWNDLRLTQDGQTKIRFEPIFHEKASVVRS